MDPEPAEISVLLDALTGGSAERFGEVLAAPTNPDYAPFEMPLLAGHQPAPPPDPLPPSFFPGFDIPAIPVECVPPISAVTGVSGVSSRSEGIRKKRQRASPVKAKKENLLAANLSAASDVSAVSPKAENKVAPKSHTRKCREKVTRQFEHLLEVLPRPCKGVEVKHKAQILEYTIKIFRELLLRRTRLQTEIALASQNAIREWMASVEGGAEVVMQSFVGLYCVKRGWKYGELWLVEGKGARLAHCVFNTDDADMVNRFDQFATMSKTKYGVMDNVRGAIGRVVTTKHGERLDELGKDEGAFERAGLAKEYGLAVAEVVPVVTQEGVRAVLLFADVERHEFRTADMMTLRQYCQVLAELYGEQTGYGKAFLQTEFV